MFIAFIAAPPLTLMESVNPLQARCYLETISSQELSSLAATPWTTPVPYLGRHLTSGCTMAVPTSSWSSLYRCRCLCRTRMGTSYAWHEAMDLPCIFCTGRCRSSCIPCLPFRTRLFSDGMPLGISGPSTTCWYSKLSTIFYAPFHMLGVLGFLVACFQLCMVPLLLFWSVRLLKRSLKTKGTSLVKKRKRTLLLLTVTLGVSSFNTLF